MGLAIPGWFRFFRNARAVWILLNDPAESWAKKTFIVFAFCLTLLYAFWPADFFPDFIPILGWLDDIGIILLCHFILNRIGMKYANKTAEPKLASCATGSLPRPP